MPEEQPLKAFVSLELVFETEGIILVEFLEEIEQFGRSLHYRERRVLGVVDDDWNPS